MYSITEKMVDWLASQGYRASTYPAADAVTPFITVERTGGYVADMVDHPTVAIQCWADTDAEADELALSVRDALLLGTLPQGVHNCSIEAGGYPFWDEYTRCPRWQLVLNLTTQLTD